MVSPLPGQKTGSFKVYSVPAIDDLHDFHVKTFDQKRLEEHLKNRISNY